MIRISLSFLVVALLALSGASRSFAQDDLTRILERDKIAAQKLQADVDSALTRSRTLEKSDPGRAAELLQDTLTKIRNATELPGEERVRLVQRLQTRIREVTAAAQSKARAEDDAARRAEQKLRQEARERDAAAGNGAKPAPPSQGPAGVASKVFDSRNAALNAAGKQNIDRNERNLNVLVGVQRSATAMEGDIVFPKNWDKISERAKPKLTEKEIVMLRALNSTLSVNWDKTSFREVIDLLHDKADLPILIDEQSLKDAMVDYSDLVTFKASKATVRTILRKVLADRGLGYILKDGMVQVVTQQKARETMVVRAYPVSDLVAVDNQMFWGPIFSRALLLQNAQRLVDMIVTSVEPSMWNVNGGPGSVTFHEASMSIVIRASAEMHYMLGGSGMISR